MGTLIDQQRILDKVLVSLFIAPRSYTGEDVVEISCHASPYIVKNILYLFCRKGIRQAKPGEFTLRAFLNGKIDLAQAESIADVIASHSQIEQQVAIKQMRGELSQKIKQLRKQLIHFASLIELELDFSEEDIAFADKKQLTTLIQTMQNFIKPLIESFALGNAIKNGIPTVIVGKPNRRKIHSIQYSFKGR